MEFQHIVSDPPEPEKVDDGPGEDLFEDGLKGFEGLAEIPDVRKRLRRPVGAFWDTCLYVLAGGLIAGGTFLIGGLGWSLIVAGLYLAIPTTGRAK